MTLLRLFATLLATATFLFAAQPATLTPVEAAKRIAAGTAVLVDCREPSEWADGVATPAVLLAKSDFDGPQKDWKPFLAKNAGKEIILYCRSGGRSGEIADTLAKQGLKAANIGTLRAWTKAGLPTRKPESGK